MSETANKTEGRNNKKTKIKKILFLLFLNIEDPPKTQA